MNFILKCLSIPALLVSACSIQAAESVTFKDKTLVVWAAPANLTQRGGSVLTLDDQQSHFDGIVFGEVTPAKWMLGSDFYRRTDKNQAAWPVETTSGNSTFVQIAVVCQGAQVTLYRDAKLYAQYSIKTPLEFGSGSAALIGLRHLESTDGACFAGAIDDARIYNTALTAEQLAALKPNQMADTKPAAWWNFENGKAVDIIGAFPEAKLVGAAHIEGGKLILDGQGSYMVTPPNAVIKAHVPAPVSYAPMPTYHFTRPRGNDGAPFDPNGAISYKGRYHLGYIDEVDHKPIWGHVSSADLIHWQMHPPMLSPGPETGIFSGNAFFDKKGRVVLSYHGLGLGGNCLAVAQDEDLNVFKKLEANPVMKDPGWDPHTWLEDGAYYSISGGNPGSGRVASLYTCTDETLAKWKLLGPLMPHDMPDVFANEDISCPDLFKLGDKHILLCISHVRGARYYVGHFDTKDHQFHPEAHHRMNWPGGTCFAPETLLDAKGRRIMWAWVLGSPYTLSLPRVLSLGADGVMHIEPVEELDALRSHPQSLKDIRIAADKNVIAEGIQGDAKELRITLNPQQSTQCGVKVRCSPDGSEETAIAYDPARKVLRIETDKSSLNAGTRPRTYAMTFMLPKGAENPVVSAQEAPLELSPGEPLQLRIYLDHSIIEVFANGRQCITQRIWPTRADSTGIALFARGGTAKLESLEAWDMAPTQLQPLK